MLFWKEPDLATLLRWIKSREGSLFARDISQSYLSSGPKRDTPVGPILDWESHQIRLHGRCPLCVQICCCGQRRAYWMECARTWAGAYIRLVGICSYKQTTLPLRNLWCHHQPTLWPQAASALCLPLFSSYQVCNSTAPSGSFRGEGSERAQTEAWTGTAPASALRRAIECAVRPQHGLPVAQLLSQTEVTVPQ